MQSVRLKQTKTQIDGPGLLADKRLSIEFYLFYKWHRDVLTPYPVVASFLAYAGSEFYCLSLFSVFYSVWKKNNYAGSEKPLPTLIKEKESLWHRVP